MKKRRGQADRGFSRKSRTQSRPSVERVESRLLLTVFTVTNTSDSTTATANDGSLRGEILASNADTSTLPNQIVFSLPPGLQTIAPVAPLPTITTSVTLDGSTASGFTTAPLIQITGVNAGGGAGLTVSSAGVVIQDLIIDNFNGDGIDLIGPGGDTVTGSYIGLDPTGLTVAANTGVGILVSSPNNRIGNASALFNYITGNNVGIQITGTGSNTVVSHNYVGLTTGTGGAVALGNTNYGIAVSTASNTIGGLNNGGTNTAGNVISGNKVGGLSISGAAATKNLIIGNNIGTGILGLNPLPNKFDGIDILSASSNTIGGSTAGASNVISGNGANGIQISGSASKFNSIQGNKIGVASNGSGSLGNGQSGVVVNGASNNFVGGTDLSGFSPQFGNIIAFNGTGSTNYYGVEILGGTGDQILSNSIYSNGGLGIKLNQANGGVQPPTITLAESGAGLTKLVGTYSGNPNETYLLQFFASTTPNASGAGDGKTYLGDLTITVNNQGVASFTTVLNQQVPVGSYVSSTATDNATVVNNTSQFGTNIQDIQAPVTDLAVSIAPPTTGPLFNQNYTYTVTVTNNGGDDDTGVVLTDVLPSQSTFVSSSEGTVANGVLTDNIGDLADGASVVVTITVKPNALTDTFTNSASVTGDGLDPQPNNNTDSTTASVVADSDLAVMISPSATTTPVGSPLTYVVTVSNFGPSVGNAVTTVVNLPSTFSSITVQPDLGSYTIDSNNNITITTGLLGVSQSSSIIITATPTATGPETVVATVSSSLTDPDTTNNTASSTVTVANAADLAIGLTANPSPVLVGNELLYTVTVTNNGPSSASSPTVLDVLPAGLTYDPANSSAGGNGSLTFSNGTVTANLNAMLSGDVDTITIAVIPTISGPITNTVTVGDPTLATSVEIDANTDNNTASTTTLVSPVDLAVTILNPSDPLFIGNQAVYQVQVSNAGPASATNVLLTESFGSGATIVSTSAGTISGNTISANLGTLDPGVTVTVNIVINPTVSGILLSNASVTSDDFDPNPSDNTSTSSNLVSPVDLAVAVTPSVTSVLTGQPVTYTIVITNNGPATATNVIFQDTLPGGTLDSYTTSQGSLQPTVIVSVGVTVGVGGNLGSLAPGASATIVLVVTPTSVGSAVNTATVTSDNVDTDTTNNTVVTTVGAINLPGSLQFGSSLELTPENSGSVTLTIYRTDGSLGAVTVDYATSDYTAIAGVNYVASSGTISFADGQTTATITIPVLDDGLVNGNNGFFVTLSNATGGASVGTPSTTGVLVTNTDRDLIPPAVSSLIAIPNGSSINGFIVTFDKAMDLPRVSLLSNYHVFVVGTNGKQTPVPLAGLQYNLTTHAITIIPTAPLAGNRFYRVVVNGSFGAALTDTSGNILFGSSGLGTNYDVFYGQGTNLTYNDSLGNAVSIKLSGGGTLGIFLAANGDAEAVNLYGTVAHKSKLTGSVKKLSKKGTGYTRIGFINGFGEFGNVYSSLTTPSFYVGSAPVGISSVAASTSNNTVNALSVSTSTVNTTITTKSQTPKGPKIKLV